MRDQLEALADWRDVLAPRINMFRRYHDGDHLAPFASQLFLQRYRWLIRQSRENLLPAAVSGFTDLLVIEDWTGDLDADQRGRLNRLASFVHREAFITGDAYSVTWNNPKGEPRAIFKRADQVIPHVSEDDPDVLDWAMTPWIDRDGLARVNIYFPDRMERWCSRLPVVDKTKNKLRDFPVDQIAWQPYTDTDGRDHLPHDFGAVPVVWWKRQPDDQWSHGSSILEQAIPAQDELNHIKATGNAAVERIAAPIRYALADKPPPGGKVDFDPTREDILGLTATSAGQFPGPDADALVALRADARQSLANIVGVPPYVFSQHSGDIPSGESLRMLNARRTAIVKAFGADSIPCWRGQLNCSAWTASRGSPIPTPSPTSRPPNWHAPRRTWACLLSSGSAPSATTLMPALMAGRPSLRPCVPRPPCLLPLSVAASGREPACDPVGCPSSAASRHCEADRRGV